jgi:hypothetical protein
MGLALLGGSLLDMPGAAGVGPGTALGTPTPPVSASADLAHTAGVWRFAALAGALLRCARAA